MTIRTIPIPIDESAIDAFCVRWNIIELAFFGSVLRPDFSKESDVDVLVTFGRGVVYSLLQLATMQNELEVILQRSVDLVDKEAVSASPNYIRRRAILESAEVVHAR